jgi:hypothetical protein
MVRERERKRRRTMKRKGGEKRREEVGRGREGGEYLHILGKAKSSFLLLLGPRLPAPNKYFFRRIQNESPLALKSRGILL